jgi:hypothetical protein
MIISWGCGQCQITKNGFNVNRSVFLWLITSSLVKLALILSMYAFKRWLTSMRVSIISSSESISYESLTRTNYPSPHKRPWAGPRLPRVYLQFCSPRTQPHCGDEACPAWGQKSISSNNQKCLNKGARSLYYLKLKKKWLPHTFETATFIRVPITFSLAGGVRGGYYLVTVILAVRVPSTVAIFTK